MERDEQIQSMIVNAIVVLILVLINGFFVAAEFALVKVKERDLRALADSGSGKAKMAQLVHKHLPTYLSSCQLGITLASLGLGWVGEPMVARSLAPLLHTLDIPAHWNHIIAFPIAFTLITFLHITIGEQVPKIYAITKFNQVSLHVAHPLHWFTVVFKPFIFALNGLSNIMLRVIGFDTDELHVSATTEGELRLLVGESQEGGHVSQKEHKMIVSILDLEEKIARRYAVPRHAIAFLDSNNSTDENLRLAAESQHTRLPLCDRELENCLGILHVKDLFQNLAEKNTIPDLKTLARPTSILQETIKLDDLLAHFRNSKQHIALLTDEFGSISGMITLENVLEEIVGQIQDEFDNETNWITMISDQEAEALGTCPIDRLSRSFQIDSRNTTADTIGGYVTELADRILLKGESVSDSELTFTVTESTSSSITKLKVALNKIIE